MRNTLKLKTGASL